MDTFWLELFIFPMSNIRRLFDHSGSSDDEAGVDKPTQSFAGGQRSGLAVEYPDDSTKNSGVLKIRVFANGFIVGSNPFRSLDIPENVAFLSELRAGKMPSELEPEALMAGGQLKIELSQYSVEFDPSNPPSDLTQKTSGKSGATHQDSSRASMFRGEGSALGGTSAAPNINISGGDIPIPRIPSGSTPANVQIRLPGGQRLTRSFNQDSAASALLDIIGEGLAVPTESLMISSGFPPRNIEHSELNSKSFKELGLCNSTVMIGLKR